MARGTRTVYPGKRNKGLSSTSQPPEEGWSEQRPKRCDKHGDKDEDHIPKNVNNVKVRCIYIYIYIRKKKKKKKENSNRLKWCCIHIQISYFLFQPVKHQFVLVGKVSCPERYFLMLTVSI